MLRQVGLLVGVLVFAGSLTAANPQDKKEGKKEKKAAASKLISAKIESVDAAKGTLSVKTKDGKEEELSIGEHTKIMDAQGRAVAAGIKDKRLATGADVQLLLDEDGKAVKEVHLARRLGGLQGRRAGIRIDDQGTAPPQAPPKAKHVPTGGTVVKVDAGKNQVVLKVGPKGKTEEKTIDVKEGVKIVGAQGDDIALTALSPGQAVFTQEKDGKVTEIRVFDAKSFEAKTKTKK